MAYVTFPGEGHGFRSAKAIRAAIDGELTFYCQILGIEREDLEEEIEIENLKK